jgi:hypothetical protein
MHFYAIAGSLDRIPGFHRLVAYKRLGRDLAFECSAAGRGGRRRCCGIPGRPAARAPNAAIKKSARKRTARGEWVNDLNRIIECPFMIMVDEEAKRALVFDARFACALTAE